MKFKMPHMERQFWNDTAKKIREVVLFADEVATAISDKELIITRVSDSFPGESGVHTCKPCRGVDARWQYNAAQGITQRYTNEEAEHIRAAVNEKFPRDDGKNCCIIHDVDGDGPQVAHFHFQTPMAWLEEGEL